MMTRFRHAIDRTLMVLVTLLCTAFGPIIVAAGPISARLRTKEEIEMLTFSFTQTTTARGPSAQRL